MIKIDSLIVLIIIVLGINLQSFSQTKIKYHERFFDNRMKWTVFDDEKKGMALIDTTVGIYLIQNLFEKEVVGKAALSISTLHDFSFSYHTVFPWGTIGVSEKNFRLNFELKDEKYRINYTQSGNYKLGKWKKIKKTAFFEPEADAILKIEYKNKIFNFYVNNVFITNINTNKIILPAKISHVEIGTKLDHEILDAYIEGHVFLENYQNFLKGEGISKEELEKKKFFSVKDALLSPKQVYKLKIDDVYDVWDKEQLPEEIFSCIYLQQVEIFDRTKDYSKIIEQLQHFQALQILDITIDSIPPEIGKLKNLRTLIADWIPVSTVALDEICKLNKLTHLDIGWCEGGGNIKSSQLKNIANLSKLEYLDIQGVQLDAFPKGIYDLKKLKYLDLSGNYIESISEQLSNLKKLEYLNLDGNSLSTIPKSIYQLTQLETLDLGYNLFETISDDIANLTKLKTLSIYHNYIKKLPINISKLTQLKELDLGYSKNLKKLPKELSSLKNLEYFRFGGHISKEEIAEINKAFSYVKQLVIFSINK